MKAEHWIIIFSIIVLARFIPFYYETSLTTKSMQENITVTDNVSLACKDALNETYKVDGLIFDTKAKREQAMSIFFEGIGESFNYTEETMRDAKKYLIPCVMLVDWDGFYVSYTQWYKDYDNATMYRDIITDKNTWNYTYGSYNVRFMLNNSVEVTKEGETGKKAGNYIAVYQELNTPAELSFMADEESFLAEKSEVVISVINEQLSYFINTHNEFYNSYSTQYSIVLPQSADGGAQPLMETPNVIAFMQGSQKLTERDYANIYCFTASDIAEDRTYYVTIDDMGSLYYHEKGCADAEGYFFEGTMESCAKKGANPDSCVR